MGTVETAPFTRCALGFLLAELVSQIHSGEEFKNATPTNTHTHTDTQTYGPEVVQFILSPVCCIQTSVDGPVGGPLSILPSPSQNLAFWAAMVLAPFPLQAHFKQGTRPAESKHGMETCGPCAFLCLAYKGLFFM